MSEVRAVRRIKRVAPLQAGKMAGVLYGALGLIVLPFMLLSSLAAAGMPAGQRAGVMAIGVGFGLFAPLIYAAMGFLTGVIGAAIYNLVARWLGGIEIELD